MKVLLVEDSARLTARIKEALEQLDGVEVVGTAGDERSAVELARQVAPDVIVLDLQLREGTGFGVLRALGTPRPGVIVLTNYSLPEYRRRAAELGVQYFLDKSREYERLPEILQKFRGQPQV